MHDDCGRRNPVCSLTGTICVKQANTLAAFLGASAQGREELVVEGMFTYAFRKGEWLMIPPYPHEEPTYQLYNLRKGPAQQHNVAKEEPRLLRQLMMRFEQIKRENQCCYQSITEIE